MTTVNLPSFLVIGAAKAGTTALYHYLKQHPEIHMSPIKEPRFFAHEDETIDFRGPGDREALGFIVTTLPEYQALFRDGQGKKASGEVSPLYLYSAKAPPRIKDYVPDAKLIAILRNPVDRAFSSFLMMIRDGREPIADFESALDAEEDRIRNNWEFIWHYAEVGFYHKQLARYFELFDRDQIKVFLYEDLQRDPCRLLKELFEFIEVDDSFVPDTSQRHNVAPLFPKYQAWDDVLMRPNPIKSILKRLVPVRYRPSVVRALREPNLRKAELSAETKARLINLFREDICRLEDAIHLDLSAWLQ
jgi:Sulfotransferase family